MTFNTGRFCQETALPSNDRYAVCNKSLSLRNLSPDNKNVKTLYRDARISILYNIYIKWIGRIDYLIIPAVNQDCRNQWHLMLLSASECSSSSSSSNLCLIRLKNRENVDCENRTSALLIIKQRKLLAFIGIRWSLLIKTISIKLLH